MGAPSLHVEAVQLAPGVLLELAARHPERYPVLLDSAAEGALSQVSLLAALPRGALWLDARGGLHTTGSLPPLAAPDFLGALDGHWRHAGQGSAARPASLPFAGGWFVYLGYELALQVEPSLAAWWPPASAVDARPVAVALRIPAALLQDATGKSWLVAEPGVTEAELAGIRADISAATGASTPAGAMAIATTEEDPAAYLTRIRRAQDYIRAGDIYQANLSRWWRAQLPQDCSAADLYRRLRLSNPAPFAGFAQFGEFRVLSSSPERLLRIQDRRMDTRPIAGTHPRGATAAEDSALKAALVAHPKERAEHVMLIDLARNDLGRVAEGGSVHVDEYMAVETYAHVHHIVSNVTGTLAQGVTPPQALRAVFPGGTITGCPKVRCMQIIAELEGTPRGPYTGSLGYLNHDGSGDFNILIRTISLYGDRLEIRAGAGIVADSVPERELAESRAKARGMLLALAP
ncbi:MAG TPA: aminodeoxychorismate synthase component I [Steroidobacteraceae bacterium]|nr:aminodeoxychorismate synthase component I [Steroidobacteraceae bacterium]